MEIPYGGKLFHLSAAAAAAAAANAYDDDDECAWLQTTFCIQNWTPNNVAYTVVYAASASKPIEILIQLFVFIFRPKIKKIKSIYLDILNVLTTILFRMHLISLGSETHTHHLETRRWIDTFDETNCTAPRRTTHTSICAGKIYWSFFFLLHSKYFLFRPISMDAVAAMEKSERAKDAE